MKTKAESESFNQGAETAFKIASVEIKRLKERIAELELENHFDKKLWQSFRFVDRPLNQN